MSKDLEEGEIEEGELLGEVADTSAGLDVSLYHSRPFSWLLVLVRRSCVAQVIYGCCRSQANFQCLH